MVLFTSEKKFLTAIYLVYLKPRLAAGHIATKIKNIIFRHHFTSSVVSISNYSEKLHEA